MDHFLACPQHTQVCGINGINVYSAPIDISSCSACGASDLTSASCDICHDGYLSMLLFFPSGKNFLPEKKEEEEKTYFFSALPMVCDDGDPWPIFIRFSTSTYLNTSQALSRVGVVHRRMVHQRLGCSLQPAGVSAVLSCSVLFS